MSKNYARISPRNEQRHRRNRQSSKSGYFVLLLILMVGITFYYVFSRGILNTDRANTSVNPALPGNASKPKTPPSPPKPRFEFYTLLSKETVPIPHEKNVTADVTTTQLPPKEEVKKTQVLPEEKESSSQPLTPALAPTGVPSIPVHINASNSQKTQITASAPQTVNKPVVVKPVPPTVSATTLSNTKVSSQTASTPAQSQAGRYVLQVAALQHRSDVERLRAQLSFIGFDVFIEPFQSNGIEWYRVKVGPYPSLEAVQKARQVLINNHLSSILITLPVK